MTTARAIEILRWMNAHEAGVPDGVTLLEINIALDLAVRALALDQAKQKQVSSPLPPA